MSILVWLISVIFNKRPYFLTLIIVCLRVRKHVLYLLEDRIRNERSLVAETTEQFGCSCGYVNVNQIFFMLKSNNCLLFTGFQEF